MRLLLDESVPSRLRRFLPNHDVKTVVEMGWSSIKYGKVLALAAADFDALLTVDKNLPYQQNLASWGRVHGGVRRANIIEKCAAHKNTSART